MSKKSISCYGLEWVDHEGNWELQPEAYPTFEKAQEAKAENSFMKVVKVRILKVKK